ncbi:flagellar biosynthesis protein FlhA [Nesterenkonia sp. NBAIMH1]|uniref:flagellar biosynthesis protein FlhA n=1 Tax=Nesterenkonia sp. NBAIMH1 TaxID=2600320 RepID=UPI00210F66E9|nr:flagellar biosynthesis protein FlhA [Nesterenkonia sp. NBAIMH1]
MLLVVPIPAPVLDVLIVINIIGAILVLMTTMFAKKPLDFSVFPSLLLVMTLLRLGINVASTRLVLGNGYAGEVIGAFGQITVGGSLIVGFVIFLILIVIQFVVVTKGAERVAEVGARFTLDAMPGKQMAIDADLNAGLITDKEARRRREEIAAEADFYGAMDGSSKFVKGDAIAGIVITLINLVGGIAIGMIVNQMSAADALNTYALLTVGDGLATQIPALLMAVSTGMIVTRANSESDLGSTAHRQLTQSQAALLVAGVAAMVMGLIAGMPAAPFMAVGAVLIAAAWWMRRQDEKEAMAAARAADDEAALVPEETTADLIEQMKVHSLEIQLAPDTVDIVGGGGDDLLTRVKALRRRLALEMGILVPPVRTRDSVDLPPSGYAVRLAGVEAGRGTIPRGKVLALGDNLESLPGESLMEPVFGLQGKWVPAELRHNAERTGAMTIDRTSVVVTHLSTLIQRHASRLLTREDVRVLTDALKEANPAAVEELTPQPLSLAEIQRVLQGLLEEQVSINDLQRIYEALALQAKSSAEPEKLIEAARSALGPAIGDRYSEGGRLRVIMLDPTLEQSMLEGLRPAEGGTQIVLDPSRIEAVHTSVRDTVAQIEARGQSAVLVCAPALRPSVRRLVSPQAGGLPVLSYQEASAVGADIETVGVIRGTEQIPS